MFTTFARRTCGRPTKSGKPCKANFSGAGFVIGIGTSAPELVVSTVAAADGRGALAVGNLAGSNMLNVTLILGVAGLVAPLRRC